MVTLTYQNSVRNILALVLATLKIFTRATQKCRLKGKIVHCAPPRRNKKGAHLFLLENNFEIIVKFAKTYFIYHAMAEVIQI